MRAASGSSTRYWARGAGAVRERRRHDRSHGRGRFDPVRARDNIAALRAMREKYGDSLFTKYGFLDSFNPSFTYRDKLKHGKIIDGVGWVDSDYLGIDQGPILLMCENYRSELVWRVMKKNADLKGGLQRAGFTGGWLEPK